MQNSSLVKNIGYIQLTTSLVFYLFIKPKNNSNKVGGNPSLNVFSFPFTSITAELRRNCSHGIYQDTQSYPNKFLSSWKIGILSRTWGWPYGTIKWPIQTQVVSSDFSQLFQTFHEKIIWPLPTLPTTFSISASWI